MFAFLCLHFPGLEIQRGPTLYRAGTFQSETLGPGLHFCVPHRAGNRCLIKEPSIFILSAQRPLLSTCHPYPIPLRITAVLGGVQLHSVPTAEGTSRWLDGEACGVVTGLKDWLEVLCERKT